VSRTGGGLEVNSERFPEVEGTKRLEIVVKGVTPWDFFPWPVYSCRREENISTDHKRNII
jgi:hypothetical protein